MITLIRARNSWQKQLKEKKIDFAHELKGYHSVRIRRNNCGIWLNLCQQAHETADHIMVTDEKQKDWARPRRALSSSRTTQETHFWWLATCPKGSATCQQHHQLGTRCSNPWLSVGPSLCIKTIGMLYVRSAQHFHQTLSVTVRKSLKFGFQGQVPKKLGEHILCVYMCKVYPLKPHMWAFSRYHVACRPRGWGVSDLERRLKLSGLET